MSFLSIPVSYSEIMQRRRDMRNIYDAPPALYYKKTIDGYILYLNDKNVLIRSDITDPSDISDFETNKIQFCNKQDIPSGKMALSHDFANNSSWVYGSSQSCYALFPPSSKEYKIKMIKGVVDTQAEFNNGELINPVSFVFHVVFWQSIGSICPSFSNTKTAFGTPLYNPGGGVTTGWVKTYPLSTDGDQRVDVWVYMLNNVPQYAAYDFYFSNVNDMKLKSSFSIEGNSIAFQFDYSSHFVNLNLRSSKNERVEAYTSTNEEVQSPNNIKNLMCFGVLEYNEW